MKEKDLDLVTLIPSTTNLVCRKINHLTCDLDGGLAIINLDNGQRFSLDVTGREIWEMISQPISTEKIIFRLMEIYDVPFSTCKQDTMNLLAKLVHSGLVTVQN